jgi:hypothetical protein
VEIITNEVLLGEVQAIKVTNLSALQKKEVKRGVEKRQGESLHHRSQNLQINRLTEIQARKTRNRFLPLQVFESCRLGSFIFAQTH